MVKLIVLFLIIFFFTGTSYADYSRIVSLTPAITSSICELDAQDKLVGVTLYCQVKDKEVIGTMLDVNIERIVSLKPDLVLAAEEWNSRATIDKLKDMGLNVVVFKNPDSFGSICDNFIDVARLVKKETQANDILRRVKEGVDNIYSKTKTLPVKKIFWQIDTVPLVTINNSTFAADLIKFSGGVNIFSDLGSSYSRISREEVIKRNPDIIIIAAIGKPAEEEKIFWSKFKEMTVVKTNRIFIVDPYKACQPTPLKFLGGLKVVSRLINPELFKDE